MYEYLNNMMYPISSYIKIIPRIKSSRWHEKCFHSMAICFRKHVIYLTTVLNYWLPGNTRNHTMEAEKKNITWNKEDFFYWLSERYRQVLYVETKQKQPNRGSSYVWELNSTFIFQIKFKVPECSKFVSACQLSMRTIFQRVILIKMKDTSY